jgi:lipopolysaccharide export system protein LptA
MYPVLNRVILFILLFSYAIYAEALPEDHLQKVHIVADSGIYNYKTGINIYEGHVKIDQGSTHVTADRLITKNNKQHAIQEAIAYGIHTLAHYWTKPNVIDPEMHARAKIIKFYPIESNVALEHEAFASQGKNTFQGELIHYNSLEQIITVPATESGHAILVYNPDKS